jgi:hypothetical protein
MSGTGHDADPYPAAGYPAVPVVGPERMRCSPRARAPSAMSAMSASTRFSGPAARQAEHLGIGNVFIPDKDVAGMEKETSFTATNHPRSSAI